MTNTHDVHLPHQNISENFYQTNKNKKMLNNSKVDAYTFITFKKKQSVHPNIKDKRHEGL